MTQDTLSEFVATTATRLGIPGVAVGVWADGREAYTCHGVTSVDNPLPVDPDTLFLLGSITKTYTATTLLRLVADGRVGLEAPVRRYVPELRLTDEQAAAQVTVLHLLNHTAGLDGGLIADFGEGDDALAGYVARMAELDLIGPPGRRLHPAPRRNSSARPAGRRCRARPTRRSSTVPNSSPWLHQRLARRRVDQQGSAVRLTSCTYLGVLPAEWRLGRQ
jgi:CubicO group peptidase (beta-lactamase class C family)